MFQKLLVLCTANRLNVIRTIQFGYVLLTVFFLFATWAIFTSNVAWMHFVYDVGLLSGKLATFLFIIVTLPGILGRFGIRHPLITIGIMFRRYTGIGVFLLGFVHGMTVYSLPMLAAKQLVLPPPLFITFGLTALVLLFPLFLTSNTQSVQMLGKNWKRLHSLVYVIFWFIFIHVAMQGEKSVAILIGLAGFLEILSLGYAFWKKRTQASTTFQSTGTNSSGNVQSP